ncbi:Hypothetical protein CINCED_3A013227 [Cinara cedri]|uniref:Reverse transcriptase domain n=1 Tax=Cinara cedri TaxID=506608 RepID=A0A5E4N167_9HEMI|nr:Hypothetical protein CINCED_3A013227 [Cinara cedri]
MAELLKNGGQKLTQELWKLKKERLEIWRHLKLFEVLSRLILMIRVGMEGSSFAIKFGHEKPEEFQPITGLKQCDALLPLLFTEY